ncbi:MAG: glycosyltransferase family 2 protein [Verrucomicrobia bacterium]|nr:glycosyltransferase family 2 protein [Verrucomicrobiota bacterium]
MKFSVLLPTKNRLEYLRYALASVLRQDYADWEIVVSDNFSEEDIKGYVDSLGDPRIKYFRTTSSVSVTENWNNALEKSVGDYVIMLGDDDCLLPGYFSTVLQLIEKEGFPDLIYTGAYNFVYPGVQANAPNGHLMAWNNAAFFLGKDEPFILEREKVLEYVRRTLDFNVVFNFNMQFSLIKRALIEKMCAYGPFFQSPYPDYYATTSMMLLAERILAVPQKLVVVGTTPKSFGFYYLNQKDSSGVAFLNNAPSDRVLLKYQGSLLPGPPMHSFWFLAMQTVKENFQGTFDLDVSERKYRFLQVIEVYKKYSKGEGIGDLFSRLRWWELFYALPLFVLASLVRISPKNWSIWRWISKKLFSLSHPSHGAAAFDHRDYKNILDVFESRI